MTFNFGHDASLDLYPELTEKPKPTPSAPPAPTATPTQAQPTPVKVRSGSGLSVRGTQMPPAPQPIAAENLSLSELKRLANAALRKENS